MFQRNIQPPSSRAFTTLKTNIDYFTAVRTSNLRYRLCFLYLLKEVIIYTKSGSLTEDHIFHYVLIFCENNNESLGFMKGSEFLDYPSILSAFQERFCSVEVVSFLYGYH
jgi:hypothetical protein